MINVYTALITPFLDDFSVDYEGLKKVTDKLISEGQRHFLLLGTTGEAALLKEKERKELVKFFSKHYKDVHLIVGISSNSTIDVIREIEEYKLFKNIEAFLIVVPYYLNPNQRGIFKHFDMIASSSEAKIIIYNIPKRTNVRIEKEVVVSLVKKHPNIIGMKQCGYTDDIRYLKNELRGFKIYMGDDHLLLEGLNEGADGIISVCSHIDFKLVKRICDKKDIDDDNKLKELANNIFIEPSPAPLKYVLNKLGYIQNKLRSPFVCVDDNSKKVLDSIVDNYKKDLKHI